MSQSTLEQRQLKDFEHGLSVQNGSVLPFNVIFSFI